SLVTFRAAARGNPDAAVRWQVSTDQGVTFTDLADGSAVAGAATPTLTLGVQPGDGGKRYRAVFTGSGTATSQAAVLTVAAAPLAGPPPSNQTVLAGRTVSFAVFPSGTPAPSVQW